MKKIIIASILSIVVPSVFAKWTYNDQVNSVNNNINQGINQLQQQISTPAGMQAAVSRVQGMYTQVGRQNDIFVFCKYGMNDYPDIHYWKAVDPSTGTFVITNYWYVNPQWIPYYVLICPMGGRTPGTWKGGGTGAEVKAAPITAQPIVPFIH